MVVFSEYERMTHLASRELTKLKIGWFVLARQRARAETWRADCPVWKGSDCKVFLSTDAGGVALNLQAASAVVNSEPPWNPARLEQRVGRVHRLGQTQPVPVIHL